MCRAPFLWAEGTGRVAPERLWRHARGGTVYASLPLLRARCEIAGGGGGSDRRGLVRRSGSHDHHESPGRTTDDGDDADVVVVAGPGGGGCAWHLRISVGTRRTDSGVRVNCGLVVRSCLRTAWGRIWKMDSADERGSRHSPKISVVGGEVASEDGKERRAETSNRRTFSRARYSLSASDRGCAKRIYRPGHVRRTAGK